MNMKYFSLVLCGALFIASEATALNAVISKVDGPKETHAFYIDVPKQTVTTTTNATGKTIQPIQDYIVRDRHIWANTHRLGKADDILAQIHSGNADLLLVRREHNSFGSPEKLLVAFSGHPIQVSEFWIVLVRDNTETWTVQIFNTTASYTWTGYFLE